MRRKTGEKEGRNWQRAAATATDRRGKTVMEILAGVFCQALQMGEQFIFAGPAAEVEAQHLGSIKGSGFVFEYKNSQ